MNKRVLLDRVSRSGRATGRRRDLRRCVDQSVEQLERRVFLSSGPPVFGAAQAYPMANSVDAVAVADVNRDGLLDIVAPAGDGGAGVVLLGNGDGTFAPGATFSNSKCYHVLAADVNGDGRVDLVMDDEVHKTFAVVLGNGDGTFEVSQTVGTLPADASIAVADLNGDRRLDLLGGSAQGMGLQVLLGNGDGTFKPQFSLSAGTTPYGLAVADFNNDGKLDIATSDMRSPVSVLLGNGNGTFALRRTLANALNLIAMSAGDVNNDGRMDLVTVCNDFAPGIEVYLGNGDGSFQTPRTFPGAGGGSARNMTLADANGDGRLDVLRGEGAVYVFLGNGDGSFGSYSASAPGFNGWSTVFGDINRDGRLDAVSGAPQYMQVDVALGDLPPTALSVTEQVGDFTSDSSIDYTVTFSEPVTGVDPTDFQVTTSGTVSANPLVAVTGGPTVYTVSVAGISGTGTPSGVDGLGRVGLNLVDDGSIRDLVGQALQRRGVTTWKPAVTLAAGPGASVAVAADLNGDGNPDIAEEDSSFTSPLLSIFLGNGDGSFKPRLTMTTPTYVGALVAADLDRDGRLDLVVNNGSVNGFGIFLGNGNGTFKALRTLDATRFPNVLAAADVNGDGMMDLVTANGPQNGASVMLGNGNGTFKQQVTYAVGQTNVGVAVSDVNGDGRVDIVVASQTDPAISVLLGNGNGTFQSPITSNASWSVSSLAVADLDSDGRPDVVMGNSTTGVEVLRGNGNGTFAPKASYGIPVTARVFPVVDLNSDGIPDLAIPGLSSYGSGLLLGNGDGTFRLKTLAAPLWFPSCVAAADFDHNGLVDLVFSDGRPSATSITVLPASTEAGIVGQSVAIVPNVNVLSKPAGFGVFYLRRNVDGVHVDELGLNGNPLGQTRVDDRLGLTIQGGGNPSTVELSFANGSPFPKVLKLDGTFDVPMDSTPAGDFLGGATLDIGQSVVTLYLGDSASPLASLQAALARGYNGGAWNGQPADSAGSIVSTDAAAGPAGVFGVGMGVSSDGVVAGMPLNAIELRYTVMGDANLDGVVDSNDALILARHYPAGDSPAWDLGNFNYDAATDFVDAAILQKNYNVSISTVAGATSVSGTSPPPITTTPPASDPASASTDDDRRSGSHKPTVRKPRIEVKPVRQDKKRLGR